MLLSIISAILLILSFPNFNLNYFVFIAFVPLFFAIQNRSPKKVFLISYICGFLFYLGVLYWLYHVTVFGLILLCLYLALYFGIFGIAISRFGILIAPIVWIILEYIQSHLFTGFGWALLGYSQYENLPLIQIADFSGVYGVSFVIIMANVAIYRLFKKSFRGIIVALIALLFVFTYGFFRLNERQDASSINVSVIQGNIPQEIKWDPDSAESILDKYINLTRLAAFDNPDLIIWPETSFPDYFDSNNEMTKEVLELSRSIRIPILLGANIGEGTRNFNSAVLISEKGEAAGKYDKIHLVPFGEYVPFSNRFPILHNLILGELGEFTPGDEFKAFSLQPSAFSQAVKFSVMICFEDIFPEIAKKFVKNEAQFLVVITNDAWYGKSPAAYQHAASSVFRAIENRVPIVRCANTGYSCFIDSRGRIYDEVKENNSHLFVTGYKTSAINLLSRP